MQRDFGLGNYLAMTNDYKPRTQNSNRVPHASPILLVMLQQCRRGKLTSSRHVYFLTKKCVFTLWSCYPLQLTDLRFHIPSDRVICIPEPRTATLSCIQTWFSFQFYYTSTNKQKASFSKSRQRRQFSSVFSKSNCLLKTGSSSSRWYLRYLHVHSRGFAKFYL